MKTGIIKKGIALLIIGLFLFFPIIREVDAYWNRGEIRAEIRRQVNDINSMRWSDAVLNDRINAAQDDIAWRTRFVVNRTTIATSVGVMEYSLPADCLIPIRVSYDTDGSSLTVKYEELTYATIPKLDRDGGQYWETTSSGCPTDYYYRGNLIGIYPPPGQNYIPPRGDLRVHYVARPSTMTADSSIPYSVGTNEYRNLFPFHQLIVWHVCAQCAADEKDTGMMNFYWSKFLTDIQQIIAHFNNQPDKQGGFSR